jgi:hypothetical protein
MSSRKVTKEEYKAFIEAYPRPLERDITGICDPPLETYNDFTLGIWPDSSVAFCHRDDKEALREYYIIDQC